MSYDDLPPTYNELDHTDPWRPPYNGPRIDDHKADWGCCSAPPAAHVSAADLDQADRNRGEGR